MPWSFFGTLSLMKALAFGNALRNVRALLTDTNQHRAVIIIEPQLGVLADFLDCIAHNCRYIDVGAGRVAYFPAISTAHFGEIITTHFPGSHLGQRRSLGSRQARE